MMVFLAQTALGLSIAIPTVSFGLLGVSMLIGHRPDEHRVHQLVGYAMTVALILSTALMLLLLTGGVDAVAVDLGTPIAVRGYHFDLVLRADTLGGIYLWLDLVLCGLISVFSETYLHREPGYHRFYLLLLAFSIGIAVIATGAGLDLVFAGWEIVGLTSALLIAFFIRRKSPVEHGLKAYAVYKITDIGLLLGVVALHHHLGTTSIAALEDVPASTALLVGPLLIFGAMGKGAIVPFTPWLPRAMEGPTPSSAIFYGALSIHASPFLLLRISPLLETSWWLQGAVIGLGMLTAVHGSMVGRVQTDIKSSLGYASVTQVGLMWMLIGMGFYTLAMVHMVGHAILRTWQLLRSPSLLQDQHTLVQSLGTDLGPTGSHLERWTPAGFRRWTYKIALERWYLDEMWEGVMSLSLALLNTLDAIDRRWALVFHDEFEEETLELRVEPLEAQGK